MNVCHEKFYRQIIFLLIDTILIKLFLKILFYNEVILRAIKYIEIHDCIFQYDLLFALEG